MVHLAWNVLDHLWCCLTSQESGLQNVSAATARLSAVKHAGNANRDIFRWVKLPLAPVWVETVVLIDPMHEETTTKKLPMYDPHELLDYLWRTGKISVPLEDIANLT